MDETDYKLKSAILEAELSKAKEQLEEWGSLMPVIRTLGEANRLQRLLGLTKTITDEQLTALGV